MIDSLFSARSIVPRRHTDQPALWILLLAGSVLLHVTLLLLLRPFWMQQAGGQSGDTIAIDLIDTLPETGKTSSQPSKAKAATSPPASAIPAPAPDPQAIQAPDRSPAPTPEPTPQPNQQPSPSPRSSQPAALTPKTAPRTASPQASDRSKEITPKSPRSQGSTGNVPPLGNAPANGTLQPPSQPSRNQTAASSNQSDGLPVVPLPAPGKTGAGLRMTIVGPPRAANRGRDLADVPAELLSPTVLTFPQKSILPCIQHNIGQTVTLLLVIDRATGKPKQELFNRGLVCNAIAELVRQNVQFRPAQQAGSQTESQVELDLRLDPLVEN